MRDKKRLLYILIISIISIFIVSDFVINMLTNFNDFLKSSFTQILSIIIAIGIAFWASQYKNDQRKGKEHVQTILIKLQEIVTNEKFYSISSDANQNEIEITINTNNRKINNYLTILDEYSKIFKFEDDFKYIRNEFEEYRTTIGNHIKDLDYLNKSYIELKRHSDNIDSKCNFIIMMLYK